MIKDEKWVSMKEICVHLGVSRDTVKKMIREHDLPAVKLDRQWKFKISEVDIWMHDRNNTVIKSKEVVSDV